MSFQPSGTVESGDFYMADNKPKTQLHHRQGKNEP